ncbi:hypothetical protein [Mangrovibacterium sp.]|uniref:hypothetical protein n=1 Tax=Mangrovibacterium sp. TaxID=1961364 RepID=UPI00356286F8
MIKIFLMQSAWGLTVAWAAGAQTDYHVSPSAGINGKGSLDSPFNSLEAANQKGAMVNKNMTDDIIGHLYGGIYSLSSPVSFKKNDLGFNGYSVISSKRLAFRNNP